MRDIIQIATSTQQAKRANYDEVHTPIDPAEKLQADFSKRFGRPDPKTYRNSEERP